MTIVRCTQCLGLVDNEKYETITLHRGGPDEATHRLAVHVPFPPGRFEPIALVPAACIHGVLQHPNPEVQNDPRLNRLGPSWIRSIYLNGKGQCPVCLGQPRPDDLTLGYTDPVAV